MAETPSAAPRRGDVATTLLFENDSVKVWEMLLEPGEASDLHHHHHPYFFVVIEGESIDADFPNGTSIQIPVEPNRVIFVPGGNTETAVNRSKVRYREILVELLGTPQPAPDS